LNHPQKISAKDIWEKDKNKTEIANSYGYQVKTIWEKDMRKATDVALKSTLTEIISDVNEN
jgi:G:T-mismatch repair DNA endonuclease (very short patch repair protein)